jgi:hypothetical protein
MTFFEQRPSGIVIRVFVQPRSAKNQVVGLHGEYLKIRLTAPPVDGAANARCLAFLSEWLDIPKSRMEILSGHAGRNKRVMIFLDASDAGAREKKRIMECFDALLQTL